MDWVPEGVTITNNKGAHADKAGEYALMAVLMLHNRMPAILSNQRTDVRGIPCFRRRSRARLFGLIGVGSIGGGAAAQLDKMPVHIIGVSRHGQPHPHVHEMVAIDQLDEVLPRMDYVFVSLPSTPETRGLFDRQRLQSLKEGAGIINVGRGSTSITRHSQIYWPVVICQGLSSMFLMKNHCRMIRLCGLRRILLSRRTYRPMMATIMCLLRWSCFFRNLQRYLAGDELMNVVRPELGY